MQLEMTKYQIQASNKWGFDFIKESPITHGSGQYRWEQTALSDIPRFYHHISHPTKLMHQPSGALDAIDRTQLFSECENICPLTQNISSPSMIIRNPLAVGKRNIVVALSSASTSFAASSVCSNQRKITGEFISGGKKRELPLIAS